MATDVETLARFKEATQAYSLLHRQLAQELSLDDETEEEKQKKEEKEETDRVIDGLLRHIEIRPKNNH